MSPLLNVDTDELHGLAARIQAAATEASNTHANPAAIRATMAALGEPGLVAASHTFLERWSYALGEVVTDAERLAHQISLVAKTCENAESLASRSFLS
ncbi:hypothetical protein [Kineosporia babensis]|uniref:Uncharacterized protein n=1 Tax=Kineosporia babensis TaxID=499548 RepID=A0A9X1SUL6_9ACTN|nr:hypothetical protein [Kineosporia babensis]MCD5312566.1 hypothetical protein [Kineosporia babensis]